MSASFKSAKRCIKCGKGYVKCNFPICIRCVGIKSLNSRDHDAIFRRTPWAVFAYEIIGAESINAGKKCLGIITHLIRKPAENLEFVVLICGPPGCGTTIFVELLVKLIDAHNTVRYVENKDIFRYGILCIVKGNPTKKSVENMITMVQVNDYKRYIIISHSQNALKMCAKFGKNIQLFKASSKYVGNSDFFNKVREFLNDDNAMTWSFHYFSCISNPHFYEPYSECDRILKEVPEDGIKWSDILIINKHKIKIRRDKLQMAMVMEKYEMRKKRKKLFSIRNFHEKNALIFMNNTSKLKIWTITNELSISMRPYCAIPIIGQIKKAFEVQLILSKIRADWIANGGYKCHYCGYWEFNASLKLCSGCQMVYFCGKRCQKMSWKNKHRFSCTQMLLNKSKFI